MAVRILLMLAALALFYGCDQPSSPPEQGERYGDIEAKGAPSLPSLGPSRQEITRQESTRQDVADMKIAFGVRRPGDYEGDYDFDLYVMNADGSNLARLADGADPAWSPDGKRFAYTKYVEEPNPAQSSAAVSAEPVPPTIDTPYIFTMDADGSGTPRKLATGPGCAYYPAWSPDGKDIAYAKAPGLHESDVYVANASGEEGHAQRPRALTDYTPQDAYDPSWSPDGTEIAFTVEKQSGATGVYKMDADGSGLTPLAPSQHMYSGGGEVTDDKISPVWSPDGEHVAYVRYVPYCDPDCSSGEYTTYPREIYVVNSDGTNAALVRDLGRSHDIWGLDWKPLS